MAIIETIKIEGDASDFNEALKELNKRVESLDTGLGKVTNEIKNFGNKGDKAVSEVNKEIKAAGQNVKNLIKNFGALAIASRAADIAKETVVSNQTIANGVETAQNFIELSITGIMNWASGTQTAAEAFENLGARSRELTEARQEAQFSQVEQLKIMFKAQQAAEVQRQIRDDENRSLEQRIAANEMLNEIIKLQLADEAKQIEIRTEAAALEFDRLPNVENRIALEQSAVELLDVEERLTSQQSEYLANKLALQREGISLAQQETNIRADLVEINKADYDAAETWEMHIYEFRQQNALDQYNYETELLRDAASRRKNILNNQIRDLQSAGQTEGLLYKELLEQRTQLEIESYNMAQDFGQRRIDLYRQVEAERFQLAKDTFGAIGQLSAAFAGEDEESKRRQFEFQKKLSLATAVVTGVEAVQNAYRTAQLAPYTAINPAYPTIQAGLAAAFAAAQVATIARSKFESSSLSSSSFGGTATTAPSQPAQFNIIGQGGTNQLVEGIAGTFERPIRAYVVSGEVISGGELQRRRLRTATFG